MINGINIDELHDDTPILNKPEMVPGRVVHIDADFLAYQVSAFDDVDVEQMQKNCKSSIEKIRSYAGAETVVLHLTPKGSDKGGRWEAAMLKEYQGNRKDKVKPRYLHLMRDWMHTALGAIHHDHCEADDGMSIAQYKAIAEGNRHLSIIATADKDLTMVPGLMLNWDTGEITDTDDDFGHIRLKVMSDGKTKKVVGRGWKFFWAQMLMGDAADNISGIPKCYTMEHLKTGKPKACGAVLTYAILENVTNNKDAFETVKQIYKDYGDAEGFKNYRDGSSITWGEAFQSEARLLWMRRDLSMDDAIMWMKETCV